MSNWQAVSVEEHLLSGWRASTDYMHVKDQMMVPVLGTEVGHLSPYYPLAFMKDMKGAVQLMALLGLRSGVNTFLDMKGRWRGGYVPAAFRSYPFAMVKNNSGENVLVADSDSAFFHARLEEGDHPIFDSNGDLSEAIKPLLAFMQQRAFEQTKTDEVVQLLSSYDLLVPWMVDSADENGKVEQKNLFGLYCIDEKALLALSSEDLAKLVKSGALGIAYAQIFSQTRLKDLYARQKRYDSSASSSQIESVDLDRVFNSDLGEDLFSF